MILIFLLIFSNLKFTNGFDINLIFSLQEHFHCNVILLPKQLGNEKMIKSLLDHRESQPKFFIGILDLNKNSFPNSPISSGYETKLVIFDDESNFIKKLVKVQKTHPKIMASCIWIYFMKTNDEEENLDLINIPYDSKFFILKEINFLNFEITDVYQISSTSSKIYSRYALWENDQLKLLRKNIFSNRRNLQGYEIKVAGLSVFGQYKIFPYWHYLSDSMNFTLKEILADELGFSFKNGTKTGILKLIYENRVHASHHPMEQNTDLLNDFSFIPVAITQFKLYVEVKQGLNWRAFITPFEIHVWIAIVVWLILAYGFVHITNRMFGRIFRFEDPFFNFITAFCYQGKDLWGGTFSVYIVALMPYVLGVVLLQYYSADLLTHLTVKDSTPPFRNIKGVIHDGTYEILSFYPSIVATKINDLMKTEARNTIKIIPIVVQKFSSGYFFHDLCSYQRVLVMKTFHFNVQVNCNVVELPEAVLSATSTLIARKRLPYLGIMSKLLQSFFAKGLSRLKLKNVIRYWDNNDTIQPIGLEIVFPAFLIFLSFLCLSVVLLLFEIITWKFKKWIRIMTAGFKVLKPKLQLNL